MEHVLHLHHHEDGTTEFCTDPRLLNLKDLVIEQYTGLMDQNNKEVYEGDIIRFTCDITRLGGCIWKPLGHVWITDIYSGVTISYNHPYSEVSDTYNSLVAQWYEARKLGRDGQYVWDGVTHLDFEVIGNVNQNPNLMEEYEDSIKH